MNNPELATSVPNLWCTILRRVCIGLHRGLGLITVLTVLPVVGVGYSATTRGLQMPFGTPHDCAYRVIYVASGQPGADPTAVHHCFAPTSFMAVSRTRNLRRRFVR